MQINSFTTARHALDQGETSCHELVSSFLERIDEDNDRLNALVSVDRDGALNHARYLDSQLERGNPRPLAGLVLAIKDNICIRGTTTTCGSKMLAEYEAVYDATVVSRLRKAGAIFIGKANCDEFAMGSSNETSRHGPVSHPDQEEFVPGGSSGGSAAAVRAGFCHAALGSDTGGSVRQPAAFCGIPGLKPTYGRVSRYGLVSYASSLDTIGVMGSAHDIAAVMNVISGAEPQDPTSAPVGVPDFTEALDDGIDAVRIGVPDEYMQHDSLDPVVRKQILRVLSRLEQQGAEVKRVSLPHAKYTLPAYYALATAEASSNLARYDGIRYGHRAAADEDSADSDSLIDRTRAEGFGDEVKRRILMGTYVLSEGFHDKYYDKARRIRTLIRQDFLEAFDEVDLLASPVTPSHAFKKGSKQTSIDFFRGDVFTVGPSLAGIPALAVPMGTHSDPPNLPVGMQLLGRHFDEALLLQVGRAAVNLPTEDAQMAA